MRLTHQDQTFYCISGIGSTHFWNHIVAHTTGSRGSKISCTPAGVSSLGTALPPTKRTAPRFALTTRYVFMKSARRSLVEPASTSSHLNGVPEDDILCGETQDAFGTLHIDAQCPSVVYTKPALLSEGEINVSPTHM